jgi:hypothetical protein
MFSSNVWRKSFDAVKNIDNSRNVIQRQRWTLDICASVVREWKIGHTMRRTINPPALEGVRSIV